MTEAVLVYDDDCGFCTWWADYFADRAELPIVGFSELDDGLRDRLPEAYEACSHLVTDDAVYSCGSSLEEAFVRSSLGRGFRPVVEFLRRFSVYRYAREWGYRRIAHNRAFWGRLLSHPPPARAGGSDDEA